MVFVVVVCHIHTHTHTHKTLQNMVFSYVINCKHSIECQAPCGECNKLCTLCLWLYAGHFASAVDLVVEMPCNDAAIALRPNDNHLLLNYTICLCFFFFFRKRRRYHQQWKQRALRNGWIACVDLCAAIFSCEVAAT